MKRIFGICLQCTPFRFEGSRICVDREGQRGMRMHSLRIRFPVSLQVFGVLHRFRLARLDVLIGWNSHTNPARP